MNENDEPNVSDTTPSHEQYKNTLADSLFDGKLMSRQYLGVHGKIIFCLLEVAHS